MDGEVSFILHLSLLGYVCWYFVRCSVAVSEGELNRTHTVVVGNAFKDFFLNHE